MKKTWQIKKLGDITVINGGGTPPTNNAQYFNGNIPWFTPSEITAGTVSVLTNSQRLITEEATKYTKVAEQGTVLLSSRATIGNIGIVTNRSTYNQGIKGITPKKELDSWYLAYWLLANKKELEKLSFGTTFKELSTTTLRKFNMVIPHLSTQQEIVEKLNTIKKLQELNQKAVEKTEELLNSEFSNNLKAKIDWERKQLGQITENLDNQRVPINKSGRNIRLGSIPYYGANGQVGWIDDFIFDEILLLVAEDGGHWDQFENSSYIIKGKSWVNNHAHVLRVSNLLLLKYLHFYLNYTDLTRYISGTTRGKLNQTVLNSIIILIPKNNKIIKIIVDRTESINHYREILRKKGEKINELFESTLNSLMKPN